MRTRILLLLSLLAAVSASGQTTGNQLPTTDRGFKPELVYQFNGFDTVNLFNGNLNLTIPLASYPVAADVSYSFVLRFSGNVFQHWWDCPHTPIWVEDPPPCTLKWTSQYGTTGLGWNLGFGELQTAHSLYYDHEPVGGTFKYISPDGAEHLFYETLHEPKCGGSISSNCDQKHPDVWYTRDGTYLRLKNYGSYKIVEFPNGERHRFRQTGEWSYQLDYIFGASSTLGGDNIPTTNWVRFEHFSNGTGFGVNTKVSDSHGREHWLYSRTDQNYGLDRATLTAPKMPADPANTAPYAEYNFIYNNWGSGTTDGARVTIPWPCDVNNQGSEAVNFLSRVVMPSGEQWKFDYNQSTCNGAGALVRATLPTGGRLNWSYQTYHPTQDGVGQASGVKERCMRTDDQACSLTDLNAAQVQYMTYTPVAATGTVATSTEVETYARNAANTAWRRDTRVKNYFAGIHGAAAGLPFTGSITDGSPSGRFLSSETWNCDPETNACPTLERRQFLKYEFDDPGACHLDYPCMRERNRRVVTERTEYTSDGSRVADVNHSEFDGLGHYRKTVTSGSFASGNNKETYTGYNLTTRLFNPFSTPPMGSDVGIYALNSNGTRAAGYLGLEYSDSWILNTYTEARTREYTNNGTITTYSDACFDPWTGFLKRKRAMRTDNDGWADPNDVLTEYTRDSVTGYPSREEIFGGDKQTISVDSLCGLSAPTTPVSRVDHTYQYGVLKTSKFFGMPWYSVNNTVIDKWTGLVLESRDVTDMATTFVYDRQRRMTTVTPPGLSSTTYTYNPYVSASSPANVQAKTGSGDLSVEQTWEFDLFGRISREKKLMPNNTWSVMKTFYDSTGNRSAVSEAETESIADYTKKTQYANYDAFGRVGTIITPDNKTTSITYAGERLTTRSYAVAKPEGEVNVSVQEERDRAGRLIKLTEDVGGSAQVVTDYTYDEVNRLSTVKVAGAQERKFHYDGRGFLTSEEHPESGVTSYTYDARGLIVDKITPVATLVHTYDVAGRVKTVTQSGSGLLKVFNYDRPSDFWTQDQSMGKLDNATRYNRSAELGEVTVKETYIYSGVGGRMSQKNTSVVRPNGESASFYDVYSYNSLGDLSSLQYPNCSSGSCLSLSAPSRSVTTTYKHGMVTAVPGYTPDVNGITYYPNGFVDTITHKNVNGLAGPQQKHTIANRMARVDSITVSNYCDSLSVGQPQPQPRSVPSGGQAGISVTASGATSYQWYRVLSNGTHQLLTGQTGSTLTSTVTEASTYFVRVGNGSCTVDSERATVTIQACTNPPSATITAPSSARASDLVWASVPDTPGATYSWSVTGGVITGNSQNNRNVSIGVGCSGVISISVTVTANGCTSTGSHTVNINPPTVAVTANPTSIVNGQSTTVTASFVGWGGIVTWSDMPGNPITLWAPATSTSRTEWPGQTTTYAATATDQNGCVATVLSSATVTVQACTNPDATITAPTSANASTLITASVPDTTGASYSWSVSGGSIASGQGTRNVNVNVGCSGTLSLTVTVSKNGCSSSTTRHIPINPATINVTAASTSIVQGGSTTIQASLTGQGPWTVTWADQPGQPVTVTPPATTTTRTVSPAQTTTYTATAVNSGGCNAAVSSTNSVTITVAPPPPTSVSATAIAPTQVRVTWAFSGSADSFNVYRSGVYAGTLNMPAATYELIDSGAEAGKAYLYKVVAVKAGVSSAFSNPDLATTVVFTDDPLTAGSITVKAAHMTQLQTAANAVRTAAGLSPQSFTAITAGMFITAAHLEEIRSAIDPARTNLLLPAAVYTRRPVTAAMVILADDMADTRDAVK